MGTTVTDGSVTRSPNRTSSSVVSSAKVTPPRPLHHDNEVRDVEKEEEEEVMYTLGQHASYLNLCSEVVHSKRYWFCDWTTSFVQDPRHNRFMKHVVKEYCQPFQHQAAVQDRLVGTSTLSDMKEEPSAVRTVMIHLRPDCDHVKVYGALNEAFAVIHPRHHVVLKNADNCFQAIGVDGNTPLLLSAQLTTSKEEPTLERYLLLRFYHVEQAPLLEEDLQKIGGVRGQMTRLHEAQTPLNNKLGEACAMLQNIFCRPELVRMLEERERQEEEEAKDLRRKGGPKFYKRRNAANAVLHEIPSPGNSTRETSRYFLEKIVPSPSVLDENWENLPLFPSLSNKDYDILQETWPLLDRIWSELEMAKCTFNTLIDETSRFGMRPCQPTLDKDYCIQLFQVSQQRMLQDLKGQLEKSESALHDTLKDYSEFEHQLTHVMMRKYNIPVDDADNSNNIGIKNDMNQFPGTRGRAGTGRVDHTSDNLDVGQTPISLTQRDLRFFPWEFDDITLALQDVTHTITCVCLEQAYNPIHHSLQVCERSVHHVYQAIEKSNDRDQQDFLKRRNRQSMIRLSQQQLYLKDLIRKLSYAPSRWGGLPTLQAAVQRWQEIAEQATNKDEARPQSNWLGGAGGHGTRANAVSSASRTFQVPLLEFGTKFGTACITQNTIVLLSEMPFFESVKAYEVNKVEVVVTPKHAIHKMAIMRHGKRLCGFSPTSIDPIQLEKFVQILKSLQS